MQDLIGSEKIGSEELGLPASVQAVLGALVGAASRCPARLLARRSATIDEPPLVVGFWYAGNH
ncbi:MAG TPA: hypothetical protein VMU73_05255 [Gaiellaceae bacterium]|nr:hypothetical protein [Gaiellaceae bacterium]